MATSKDDAAAGTLVLEEISSSDEDGDEQDLEDISSAEEDTFAPSSSTSGSIPTVYSAAQNEADLLALIKALEENPDRSNVCYYCFRLGHTQATCPDKENKEHQKKHPIWMQGRRQRSFMLRSLCPDWDERMRLRGKIKNKFGKERRKRKRQEGKAPESTAHNQKTEIRKASQSEGGITPESTAHSVYFAHKNEKDLQILVGALERDPQTGNVCLHCFRWGHQLPQCEDRKGRTQGDWWRTGVQQRREALHRLSPGYLKRIRDAGEDAVDEEERKRRKMETVNELLNMAQKLLEND